MGIEWKVLKSKKVGKWLELWRQKNVDWEVYRERVEPKLQRFLEEGYNDIKEGYKKWQGLIIETAEETVGKKKIKLDGKNKSKSWWNKEIGIQIRIRKDYNRECRGLRKRINKGEQNFTEELVGRKKLYESQKTKVTLMIRDAMEKNESGTVDKWREMDVSERLKEQWNYINSKLKGTKSKGKIVLNKHGFEVDDDVQIKEVMEDYWRNIFWNGSIEEVQLSLGLLQDLRVTVHGEEDLFSKEDLEQELKRLKNNKATDEDEFKNEFLKAGGEGMKMSLLGLFNEMVKHRWVFGEWQKSRVCLHFKGGSKSRKEIGSYRPVAIMSVVGKLMGGMICRKIESWIGNSNIIGEEQNGFRKGRGTMDNVYVLNEIVEVCRKKKKTLYVCFLDIEKAFDRVNREKLWKRLQTLGMEDRLREMVQGYYAKKLIKLNLNGI